MNIQEYKITLNGQDIFFFSPKGEQTIFGGLSVLNNNKFKLNEVEFLENDVVVDIGSNVGIFNLTVSKFFPHTQVLAFDMNPIASRCNKMGIVKNGILNSQIYNFGLSDKTEEMECFSESGNPTCSLQSNMKHKNHDMGFKSRVVSIQEIFDSPIFNINKVKYLKIDIEGGEFAIFDYLFYNRPDILDRIEYLHCEIHKRPECDFIGLEQKLKDKFGNKLFLDC